jgi:hypothetical protein
VKPRISTDAADRSRLSVFDFIHFLRVESLDLASPLFSTPEFLNIALKNRHLKIRVVDDKELIGKSTCHLQKWIKSNRPDPPHPY